MFERSPIGMYRSTVDGRFVFVNPALVAMLGYASADELMAIDLSQQLYVDPEEREPLVQRYLSQGVVDGVDVRWRRKDGRVITVRVYGHAVDVADGAGAGFDVTAIDVTALRAAEADARAQRSETQEALLKLRSLMKQLPALVWTVDRDLRLMSFEGTLFEMRGDLVATVAGRSLPEVVGDRPSALAAVMHHRAAFGGATAHFELEWDDKLFLMTVAPMRDGAGAITAVIGAAVDVTAMRRMERNVQTTQRIESLGILAGGVAHDFNNLLVAMLGNADLALRECARHPEDAAVRTAIEAIRAAALRASELTNQLLAYTGRGQLAVGEVEIGPLVEEMVALLASGRTGKLSLSLSPVLPPVRGDAAQLRQVVMNLVTNAFDALDPHRGGEVRVRTRVVALTTEAHALDVISVPAAGRYVAIEVGDSGIGMDTSTRRKIFDPFFTTKARGHGLGLAAVLGIVRGHRGGLRLFSNPGQGSVFEILLPAEEGAATAASPPALVAVPAAAPAPAPAGERTKTVLVVDDEEMVREVLCNMIEDLGYRALPAAGGAEALAAADDGHAFDAAIVDLTMPLVNGRAVLDGLRARRPRVPVILTSGYDRDRAAVPGADGFLRKPFRFETLEQLLRDVVGA